MKYLLSFFLIIFLSCDQRTLIEIDKEYLESSKEGYIKNIERYKGGGYILSLENDNHNDEIGVYKFIGEKCRKGDYFKKIKNSNKCLLKRKDSLICADCIVIEDEIRDSLKNIREWKFFEKDFWKTSTTASH